MVERRSPDGRARPGAERLAGAEIVERDIGAEHADRDREKRRHHHLGQHVAQRVVGQQMPGPEAELVGLGVGRAEER